MSKSVKWFLILAALAVVVNVAKESMRASKEVDTLVQFSDSCARQARESGTVPPEKVQAVCACTSDKSRAKFGTSRFAEFLGKGMAAPEADRAAFTEIMVGCMMELG